jgi:hypothetical protein
MSDDHVPENERCLNTPNVMDTYTMEILSMVPARSEGDAVLVMNVRLPSFGNRVFPLQLTQEQAVRMRNAFDKYLNDPQGWFYMPPEIQEHLKNTES